MSTRVYTRESLLAEWETLHPSEPMPLELQVLCLAFTRTPRARLSAESRPQTIPANTPPPQRFQRRGSKDVPPAGPSKARRSEALLSNSTIQAGLWFEASGAQTDEMDLAFEAIHTNP